MGVKAEGIPRVYHREWKETSASLGYPPSVFSRKSTLIYLVQSHFFEHQASTPLAPITTPINPHGSPSPEDTPSAKYAQVPLTKKKFSSVTYAGWHMDCPLPPLTSCDLKMPRWGPPPPSSHAELRHLRLPSLILDIDSDETPPGLRNH